MNFRALKKTAGDVYINEPVETDKDGNTLTLLDLVDDGTDINDQVELNIHSQQLYKFLKENLSEREHEILTLRYGLYNTKRLKQEEIAKKLNISRSYVSSIA